MVSIPPEESITWPGFLKDICVTTLYITLNTLILTLKDLAEAGSDKNIITFFLQIRTTRMKFFGFSKRVCGKMLILHTDNPNQAP
jgi:hypothetical protein